MGQGNRQNALFAFALAVSQLGAGGVAKAQSNPDLLPVFTSAIDVTGLKLQLRAAAPDRESGKLIDVALPLDLVGPKFNQLLSTPLSSQLDQYWNVTPDPITKQTPRQAACDAPGGIRQQVANQVAAQGPPYVAYDVTCDLAATGKLLAKQVGSTMYLAYLLTGNTVTFASTSPQTCKAGHGTPVCPNDPRFRITFASEITTVMRTPSLCGIAAEDGTVNVVAASFEATNGAAGIGRLFAGQKFVAGEEALTHTVQHRPLPVDASLGELRTSDACTRKNPDLVRLLVAFRDLETVIDPRQGIILRAIHAGIAQPSLDVPNPGFTGPATPPSVPSFTRPTVSTAQPLVTAGNPVQVAGQHFPANLDLTTSLPVTLHHGGYGANSTILGGVCFHGVTNLQWGPAGAPPRLVPLPGGPQGECAPSFRATGLTPNTSYAFSARDCDPITCSPSSATARATTGRIDANRGAVALTLDAGTPIGRAVADAAGAFQATAAIPANTPAGAHTIHAVAAGAKADAAIQVVAASPSGARPVSIMMVGLLSGESGCPNHPISSTAAGNTFMLFGSGFSTGVATVRLDTATGAALGTAAVRADGSLCQSMNAPPVSQAGAHSLLAIQNGAVVTRLPVTFVVPSVVR